MHEWGIVKSVIDEIVKQAKENSIKKIEKVTLSLGDDDHLTPDTFKFCFNILAKETPIAKIKLRIKKYDKEGVLIDSIEGSK
ncbi:MAG: hydrogenase maturation nickel metallochaperone HypA [Candidatus Omnitrophica bacterium]|nr:hydrogenase maturation nickel metallochaperone HypA [Candidatus Omnitrophota bacterium]